MREWLAGVHGTTSRAVGDAVGDSGSRGSSPSGGGGSLSASSGRSRLGCLLGERARKYNQGTGIQVHIQNFHGHQVINSSIKKRKVHFHERRTNMALGSASAALGGLGPDLAALQQAKRA